VEEYDWEILVEEDAENAATREDTLLGLLYVKDFPDKKAEQDTILVMATPRIPVSFKISNVATGMNLRNCDLQLAYLPTLLVN